MVVSLLLASVRVYLRAECFGGNTMGRHLLVLMFLFGPLLEAMPALAFDSSEYRQNTYGPPTHYCDPTRPLTNNGRGTLADPWNLTQCANLPVAGNVVGILPGVSVRLRATNDRNIPAFHPANSGTATQPIVYVTKYAAVALPDVANNPNRTQLRHDGPPPCANGCPTPSTATYGSYQKNYIIFDGFYVDVQEAWTRADAGIIRAASATGVKFLNFVLKGTTVSISSNAAMIRTDATTDVVFQNFKLIDWVNDPSGSGTPQEGFGWVGYGDHNFLFSNFETDNVTAAFYPKGTSFGRFNYGTIQYGIIKNSWYCFQLNDTDTVGMTVVQYNVCNRYAKGGFKVSSETTAARNVLIHHNTFARGTPPNGGNVGTLISYGNGFSGTNVTIRDNIFDQDPTGSGRVMDFFSISSLPNIMNYNGYYRQGGGVNWLWNGSNHTSLSAWRSASNRDMNSLMLPSDPFVSRSGGDYRIVTGHLAKTASSTGGELGAYGGNIAPGLDLSSYTADNRDLIPPTAPRDVLITN